MRRIKIRSIQLGRKYEICDVCGTIMRRHSKNNIKFIKTLGIKGPTELGIVYGKYWCSGCLKHYSARMGHFVHGHGRHSKRVVNMALGLLRKHPPKAVIDIMKFKYFVDIRASTLHGWSQEELCFS